MPMPFQESHDEWNQPAGVFGMDRAMTYFLRLD